MKAVSVREAKHRFGQLITEARAEPVVIEKHGAQWSPSSRSRNTSA